MTHTSDILFNHNEELLKCMRKAAYCQTHIKPIAEEFSHITGKEVSDWLAEFVEDEDIHMVKRLLLFAGLNHLKLDPEILCRCYPYCRPTEISFCFPCQDETLIDPLIKIISRQDLLIEQFCIAVRIATEWVHKYEFDDTDIRRYIYKGLKRYRHYPELFVILNECIEILDDLTEEELPSICDVRIEKLVPDRRSPRVIAKGTTAHHSTQKPGRNDPCPCGSGKKYKKCCANKTEEDMVDIPITNGGSTNGNPDLLSSDSPIDDIDDLLPWQIKKLVPIQLQPHQVYDAFNSAFRYGFSELALTIYKHEQMKPPQQAVDLDVDMLHIMCFRDNDYAMFKKVINEVGPDNFLRPHCIKTEQFLFQHPDFFNYLDDICMEDILSSDVDSMYEDDSLITFIECCHIKYPALGIILGRAFIASRLEESQDAILMLDLIEDARIKSNLPPWGDPVETVYDLINESNAEFLRVIKGVKASSDMEKLNEQVKDARMNVDKKNRQISELQSQINTLQKRQQKKQEAHQIRIETIPDSEDHTHDMEVKRLRQKVQNLKNEIQVQQATRTELRQQLKKEKERSTAIQQQQPETKATEEPTPIPDDLDKNRILIPEFKAAFKKQCDMLPANTVTKALQAATGFATNNTETWQHIRRLEQLPDHYRVRIGMSYRMLVRWIPNESLEILDIIPRQDLETWIKRHL